eukprot:Gb_36909 [translate_table: standard]
MPLSEILVLVLKLSFIIHLSSSLAHPSPNFNSSSSFKDQQSLLSFKKSISYDHFNALHDWNSSVTFFCDWSGLIPPQLGQLTKLWELNLYDNNLTGTIPSYLSNISTLTHLNLATNNLSGAIPPQLGMLTRLEYLALSETHSLGVWCETRQIAMTKYMGKSADWQHPQLPHQLFPTHTTRPRTQQISVTIPMELGQLALLEFINLSGNQLVSGSNTTLPILTALTNCSHLQLIDLGDNHLTGVLPVSIGQLSTELYRLRLSGNNIGGETPKQIATLTNLRYLALRHNSFTGRIPSALGRLGNLERFYLDANKLEGSIASKICQQTGLGLLSLYVLDLSHNTLRGKIPPEVAGLQNLIFLNLSWNMLEGRLPPKVGKMEHVQEIDISKHKLGGKIPATIESYSELQSPKLSWNALQGPIPNSLAQLKSLEDVDLSCNNLSGSIPKSLEKLGMLRHLNLSFNNFAGDIPRAGVFTNHTVTSFMGNPELIDGTNGFNEANRLGVGSFGAVYKAIFRDGRMAAVKVLNLQNEEAHKSFSTECKALGRVRHRNLVKNHNILERVKIAIDIAHAIEYLHHHSPIQVVHCDLKPANVLLDENMTAHVGDFGIARITCENSMDLHTSTIKVKGSVGSIAPEYGQGGMVSAKGDVYSYGILLLEMLTRKRPTDDMFSEGLNLQKWVNMAFPERMVEVVDEYLFTNVSDDEQRKIHECVREMMGVGLACTKEMPQHRPQMTDVVRALESIREAFVGSTWTSRFTPSSTIEALLHITNAPGNGVSGQSCSSSTY